MGCDVVIAKTQSGFLPPPRGKVRMGVGLTRSQDFPSSPRLRVGANENHSRKTELLLVLTI